MSALQADFAPALHAPDLPGIAAAAIARAFAEQDDQGAATIRGATAHLQPILALRRGGGGAADIIAVEALARWRHPALGAVPPADLMPAIGPERAARLSAAVRAQALAAFALLWSEGLGGARLALNLSAAEVAQPDIALRIADEIAAAGVSLLDIELEITEEVLLERVSRRTLDQLAALRGRGARLVLDDFGTGNSGLAQLLLLPLDGLKLDKQFVQRLGVDPRAEAIVRATVSLAHGLDMSVVGEGVETVWQEAMLRDLGCDAAQGFRLARPMPVDTLWSWLRGRAPAHPPEVVPRQTRPAHVGAML
jgi:EAL domain-containing protein (putative c-di-GMP-specific phosphodiesterase class I)